MKQLKCGPHSPAALRGARAGERRSTPTWRLPAKQAVLTAVMVAALGARADDATTPAIAGVVAAGTKIELIHGGFEGTEGPLGLADGSLIFTETRANRVTRIGPDNSLSTYLERTNGSNGLGLGREGELISVQVVDPKVGVIAPAGKAKVLADEFNGKPFIRPNDLVVSAKRGDIYFTDSGAVVPPPGQPSLNPAPTPRPAVYRITPKGELLRVADDIERPNGIQLSPDEKTLYVANTLGEWVYAYDIGADGAPAHRRKFAKLDGFGPNGSGVNSSGADGLAVDAQGRLYVASTKGIQVFDAGGKALGTIAIPKQPQNLAFAGEGKKSLFVVGRGAAYRIRTLTAGFAGRAK